MTTLPARRARQAAALAWRHIRLLAERRLVRLPIDDLTDEFAFAPTSTGWNYYTAILDAYDRDPHAEPAATDYGRFFAADEVNAVRDLNDVLDLHDGPDRYGDLPRFWLGTYPWGGLPRAEVGGAGPAFGWAFDAATGADTKCLWGYGRTLWYEPCDAHTIDNEWRLTIDLYRSMRRSYSPLRARGFPSVTLLRNDDGRQRAIMVDGHHRLAILAHLGVRSTTVEIEATIDASTCADWHYVRQGYCTAAEARRFFDAFFELDGTERFERVRRNWGDEGVR